MSPEELDEARAKETLRRLVDSGKVYCHEDIAALGARLARENWTPPEPVDPDILAFHAWRVEQLSYVEASEGSITAKAFLAGARTAREQERERAKFLLKTLEEIKRNGPQIERLQASHALSKYQGEA